MSYFLYQFEAVSIQDYILSGGKIKTMVGASELLEAITDQLLPNTIEKLGLVEKPTTELPEKGGLNLQTDQVVFSRKAGGVFLMILQNQEKANQFAELWPVLVSNFAPGMKFSAALQSGDDFKAASKALRTELNNQKNQPQTTLPESTPLTVRFQKTGKAQIQSPKNKDGRDWTMHAKLENKFETLGQKHLNEPDNYHFPKQFEHNTADDFWKESFPFKSLEPGNHSVAIVHTDGNGLGGYLHKIFEQLNETSSCESIKAYAAFSTGLDKATQKAAKAATQWLIDEYEPEENPYKQKSEHKNITPLPMRPLILGGDDLTCIVRADLAFGFAKIFTERFEHATTEFVQTLKKQFGTVFEALPDTLTCTTGMVFLKSNQPFSLGYALAEGLCSEAKKTGRKLDAKMPPSLMNFLYTTNTLFDEIDTQFEQELKTMDGQTLSLMPYGFSSDSGRPTLQSLFDLSKHFDKDDELLNPSAVRNLASKYHQGQTEAESYWTRWENRSAKSARLKKEWSEFKKAWNTLNTEQNTNAIADLNTLFSLEIKNPFASEEQA